MIMIKAMNKKDFRRLVGLTNLRLKLFFDIVPV